MNDNIILASIILDLNITTKYKSYLEVFFENSAPFLYLIPHFKKIYLFSQHFDFVNRFKDIHYKNKKKCEHLKFIWSNFRDIIPYFKKVIFCNPLDTPKEFWDKMRIWKNNNLLIIYSSDAPKDFIKIRKLNKKYIYLHESELPN